jgi:DNA-binding response OmpR family regulator
MPRQSSPLVLVADDDFDIANLVCYQLRRAGLRTLQVSDGVDALRAAMQEPIDLAILDIGMPGLDGTAVLRILRSRGDEAPPVIFLTARTRDQDRVAGIEAGAVDYVTKPFSGRDLVQRAQAALAAR